MIFAIGCDATEQFIPFIRQGRSVASSLCDNGVDCALQMVSIGQPVRLHTPEASANKIPPFARFPRRTRSLPCANLCLKCIRNRTEAVTLRAQHKFQF